MERAATAASSLEVEQDSDAQTRQSEKVRKRNKRCCELIAERELCVSKAGRVKSRVDTARHKLNIASTKSFSMAEVRKNKCMYLKNQGGYKQIHFKGMSYEEIRPIFKRVWDQIYAFVPMDSDIEKEAMKKSGFDLQQKQFAKEVSEKKDDNSSKPVGGSRKKIEKEELRQDLNDLYSLVPERFQDHPLEGHDLLLWGDLRMIFDPDENDELWMNQLDWKLLRWKLHENYGVHTLFIDGELMKINMLVEKKYPLIKKLLEKILILQLEAEEESTMASELIKFIKSLLEEY
nr:hypothetical protein [Tanacetum cinerariifolium]